MKCYGCKKEWSIKRGSVLENYYLSPGEFLGFLKLYQLGIPNNQIEQELNLSHPTITNLTRSIRSNLLKFENQWHLSEDLSNADRFILTVDEACKTHLKILKHTPEYVHGHLEISISRTKTIRGEYGYKFNIHSKNVKGRSISELERFLRGRAVHFESYFGRDKKELIGFIIEKVIRYNCEGIDSFEILMRSLVA